MSNIVREDFYGYFDSGLKVIPLENGKPLVPMWNELDWDELPSSEIIINSWFDLYGDRINGIGFPLGESHNFAVACIRIDTTEIEVIERIHTEFNPKVSCHAGKIQYLFFTHNEAVQDKFKFKCPTKGDVQVLYRNTYAILPPSQHSAHTYYEYSDSGFATLLNTGIHELTKLQKIKVEKIGALINSPTVDAFNVNLPNDEQFHGRLKRKESIDSYLDKIYDRNPHTPPQDTISQILDYDLLNFPNASFFLGDHWGSVSREANAFVYVAEYNAKRINETGLGATFDNKIESEQVVFNKLVPIDEAHTKFDTNKSPIFDNDLIPLVWRPMIEEIADGQGFPPQALFMAMFTTMGACMQGNTIIRPHKTETFFRRPNLAISLVASSGSKKSDVIRIATKEAVKINKTKGKRNSQDDLTRVQDLEGKIEMLTKEKKKPGADIDKMNDEIRKLQDDLNNNPLKGTKFIYGNATVQRMIYDAKKNQDTGLFMIKDEMKQIYAEMRKKGNEDYRTFYMEGFDGNGDGFTYSTLGRNDDHIEKHFLSLLTAVQNDVVSMLIKQLYASYGENDGFLQRIILVPFGERKIKMPRAVDFKKFNPAYEIFNKVHYHDEIEIHVAPECVALYDQMRMDIQAKAARYESNGPLSSILFKHEGFLCVFATIYEALLTNDVPKEIGEEALRMAMRLLDYIGECAKYLFDVKDRQEDKEAIVTIAKMLTQRHFRNEATQSEWYQSVKHIFKFPHMFYNALRELELRGYVAMKVNKSNSMTLYINPEVNRI